MVFRDRTQAGVMLAERLVDEAAQNRAKPPLVVGLPRGGVPVAAEIARRLNLPLEVLVVRKLGALENPEFAIGAIAESGYFWINPSALNGVSIQSDQMERVISAELEKVRRGVDLFRDKRGLPRLKDRTVIVVDDGIATGATAVVAARCLRSFGAARVIIAAPVCARSALSLLHQDADEVVCLDAPERFFSVGDWYEDFSQVTDDDVIRILHQGREPLDLAFPEKGSTQGIIIFAHGSGSSRFSPRNRHVARILNEAGFATYLFDLLTDEEASDRSRVFDIPYLAERLVRATSHVENERSRRGYGNAPIGYFGASTGAAAALWAAADVGDRVRAIVSRGGRPDLAASRLTEVRAPTLLIVGSLDRAVIEMNERARQRLPDAQLTLIDGATHLFEEPGALDEVARRSIRWFEAHLSAEKRPPRTKKKAG